MKEKKHIKYLDKKKGEYGLNKSLSKLKSLIITKKQGNVAKK
jgi:hypothetical protein